MSPKVKLRRFLYLDAARTDEFLAQAEGGIYDEESQKNTGHSSRGMEGKFGYGPVGVTGGKQSGSEEERTRVMRQTEEAAFSRLANLLEENESVQWLENLDKGIWDQLKRSEVLEVECSLEVPPLMKALSSGAQFKALGEVMEAAGEEIDTEMLEGLKALEAMSELFEVIPVVGRISGDEDYQFVAQINPDRLRVPIDEIEGEARLYCMLDRKLKEGEQFTIADSIAAIKGLPNREELAGELGGLDGLAGEPVTPPASVVTPIAIFR